MAYTITKVKKTGIPGVLWAEVSDGTDTVTIYFNKKELATATAKKKLKVRIAKAFQQLNTDKTEEDTAKTALESIFTL